MRRNLFASCIILLASSFAASQRLPEMTVPESYKLSFALNLDKENFTREETIQIRVLTQTSVIVLNDAEINFQEASVSRGGVTQNADATVAQGHEMACVAV